MVKKHHAWKVTEEDVHLYGEDIYGVHSIAYEPVAEDRTFYAFALRRRDGGFAAFTEVEAYAKGRGIPVVPVLFQGCFRSVMEIRAFLNHAHGEPSVLGGEREGVVLRLERGFPASEFRDNVCKSVRLGHVQTDEHWTRNWRPCRIAGRARTSGAASASLSAGPRAGLAALSSVARPEPCNPLPVECAPAKCTAPAS